MTDTTEGGGSPAKVALHEDSALAAIAGPPAVAAISVTKRFPGVIANDGVSFEAAVGEVHALLGENGAGKTTLCNVLMGLYKPDAGELRLNGHPVRFRSPREAHAAGIFMVHQHLRLVESMSVSENVVLGWSRRRSIRFSPGKVEAEVAHVAEQFHMPIDPRAKIWQLSLGERQRVEILKALYRGARILILDEPTTVLTPQESDQLFASVREMAAAGGTIIFISHKLPEVMAVSNQVTILRKGRTITTVRTADTDARGLARLMVGHEVAEHNRIAPDETVPVGGTALVVDDVSAEGDLGVEGLRHVSLTIEPGRILGIAGVAGNGQRELAETIAGLRPTTTGTIRIGDDVLRSGDARAAIDQGIAYVPEDRMGTGVAPNRSIADNMILKSYRNHDLRRGPFIRRKEARARARELMQRFDVRAPGPDTLVRQLSGGNVQRVLLARELSSNPRVVVAASPTRGLDVSATQDVRQTLLDAASSGVGVMLISEDLDEVLTLSDRVAVLYGGRVVGIVRPSEVSREQVGLMMAGGS
jgi:general nucleoside transport system ATP-binding protein